MKTKPTRFIGWAGKNLAVSLATRRRRSTTTHGTGDARKEHVFRIEAPSATVKRHHRREVPLRVLTRIFCIATGRSASFLYTGIRRTVIRVSGVAHGQRKSAAGDGAVGCFFFQAVGRKFPRSIS